jgi:hypothetical protein
MKKYYIQEGKKKLGPFDLNELEELQIHSNTIIWFKGLKNWTQASKIDELKNILENTPPPLISENPWIKGFYSLSDKTSKILHSVLNKNSKEDIFALLVLIAILGIIVAIFIIFPFENVMSFIFSVFCFVLGYQNICYARDIIMKILVGPFEIVMGFVFLYCCFNL